MKRGILLLAVWIMWLSAGCVASETTPTVWPTETNIPPTAAESALQLVTPTPTTTTAPSITPLPIETATTIPPTETTEPTTEPFTDGFIALTWNPDEEHDRLIMTHQLDFIYPGEAPDEWFLETKLEDLYSPYMFPSPDQNKLLLTQYKDSNGDGRIPSLGLADIYDIYLYHIADETLTLLVENDYARPESFWFPSPWIFWFPDSNKFTYRLEQKVMSADIVQPIPTPIINLTSGHIFSYELSPDGNWLAVFNTSSDNLGTQKSDTDIDILNLETEETITLAEGVGPGRFIWSPNSFDFAFNESGESGLYIADAQTFAMTELVANDNSYVLSSWSPDSRWLAYSYDRKNVHIWDVKDEQLAGIYTLTPDPETTTQFYMKQIKWLPDNSGIVLAAGTLEKNKLVRLDRIQGVFEDLLIIDVVDPMVEEEPLKQMYDFSPDGQWLLFYADIEGTAGFYVVYHDGGAAHLVLETGKKYFRPYHVSWLDAVP